VSERQCEGLRLEVKDFSNTGCRQGHVVCYVKQEHGDRMNSVLRRSDVICDVTPCVLSYIPGDCAHSHRPQHLRSFVLLIYWPH
jgi:hypothetical protein